jgi:hypothetical protein
MRQIICGLTLFGLGGLCGSALALDPAVRELDDRELLRTYWFCDREASLSAEAGERFDESLMQLCGGVSHELQSRRFGGDFNALHHWTGENRAAAHAAMDDATPLRSAARPAARNI